MAQHNFDIVIVGSGTVGATMALLLARNPSLRIGVLEAEVNRATHRVSAISLASKNVLTHLGVWQNIISTTASPYHAIQVWDELNNNELQFTCRDINETELGYIIADQTIRSSLHEAFQSYPNIHFIQPIKLQKIFSKADEVELETEDNIRFVTKLLIAADGANSWVRTQAGIDLKTYDYEQTAIVATIETELMHDNIARQRFLQSGPLAFLPLSHLHQCSIVWSVKHDLANELMHLEDDIFNRKLTAAFDWRLGKVTAVSPKKSFPLRMRHAKKYLTDRIVLIGDAAHTIHPLLGQGVNLGLLDAACLAEVINTNASLRRYERWRKSDNATMLLAAEIFSRVFTSDKNLLRFFAGFGMGAVNQVSFLKKFFINYAVGKRDDVPMIAK